MAKVVSLVVILFLAVTIVHSKSVKVPIVRPIHRCMLPQATGDCKAYIRSWYFDGNDRTCKQFTYTGCKGNDNRFVDSKTCLEVCAAYTNKPIIVTVDKCSQPPAPGNCKSHIKSWYFDRTTQRCKEFVYTGCKGNENRFSTEFDCSNECRKQALVLPQRPKPEEVNVNGVHKCLQPKKNGNCFAYIPSYFFDNNSKTCRSFIYGGCGGNDNRFRDENSCLRECRSFVKPRKY